MKLVTDDLDEISSKLAESDTKFRIAYEDLAETPRLADAYIDAVNDLFHYSSNVERMTDIAMTMDGYVDQLRDCMVSAEEVYLDFEPSCKRTSENCARAAGHCNVLAREAGSKENTTRAVGRTAAGVAMAAGVAASVLAGMSTLGIGTVVGLCLTAAGAVAAGTVAVVATDLIASDYAKAEKVFRKLSAAFDGLYRHTAGLNDNVVQVRYKLEHISAKIDQVVRSRQHNSTLLPAFELLQRHLAESYMLSSRCSETIQTKRQELRVFMES